MPFAVVVLSVIAWTTWEDRYAYSGGTPIEFRVVEQTLPTMTPAEALAELDRGAESVFRRYTHLSENPFWFRFHIASTHTDDPRIEFPSRHAQKIECWSTDTLQVIGSADTKTMSSGFFRVKSGFGFAARVTQAGLDVLCKTSYSGPARISILQWRADQLAISTAVDHHRSGLLEGSLMMLAAFVLIVAVVNQEWMYVLFAAWLVGNLRVASLSAGWDTQWLGHDIPLDLLHPLRKLTIATNYILTYTLFARLFSDDLKRVGYAAVLNLAQWMSFPLLVAALVLPYGSFLPVMWGIVALGAFILVFMVSRILFLTRSAVAKWYGASIAIAVLSSVSEIVSAALGLKGLISAGNSVTAAASSSLMAALAIAAQMREERRQRVHAQEELRGTYDALPIGLFTLDLNGDFIGGNPALRAMLCDSKDRGGDIDRRWQELFGDESWELLRLLASGGGDIEVDGRPGSFVAERTFHVKATVAGDRIEGSMQDVTDRAKATGRLEYLSEYDPLTDVLNRRGIEKALQTASRELLRSRPLAIAYLDLDRFKLINDLYGHTTGDDVLKDICQRIRQVLGPDHHVGRVGGDEFVVIFVNKTIAESAAICQQLIEAVEDEACHIGDKAFQVKVSIGLIEVMEATVIRDVISIADRACREAKRTPGTLVVYERGAAAFRERSEELALIGRFGVSRVPEGLFLDMQPIMSLSAPYDSLDFEVLLRLREADNSITPAGKVIAAAENNGRISLIDRWVLSTTLHWLAENRDRLRKTNFICINLSGGSLNDEKFIRDAFAMITEAGDIAKTLCFEITESVALHDLRNTSRFIDTVRSFGAKVALDDFGAGYTSFSYLKELAAEAVKIDGAFVRDVNSHPANLAIVEAIAELSHNLGMKTIAEWAEDAATVAVLAEVGVDYVQGYGVARPMSPERILAADSCGALIEDPQVARYVWDGLGKVAASPGTDGKLSLQLPPLPIRRRH
ncbi:MAG: EAL domain-containing protein [Gammaproteobacteria bacterium]|nr:EAL domain-containing protein [Gammaproteobacteria bacterium]MBU1414818.1 EAL domain-containing protein [Gammaproteobacteria bacterium]